MSSGVRLWNTIFPLYSFMLLPGLWCVYVELHLLVAVVCFSLHWPSRSTVYISLILFLSSIKLRLPFSKYIHLVQKELLSEKCQLLKRISISSNKELSYISSFPSYNSITDRRSFVFICTNILRNFNAYITSWL